MLGIALAQWRALAYMGSIRRAETCAANLKCLSTHLLQYAQDYNERLPPARGWNDAILPYVGNVGPFRCPADRSGQPVSYGYNGVLPGRRLSEFPRPDRTILLFDATPGEPSGGSVLRLPDPPRRRAAGGNIFAFLDGHTRPLGDVDRRLWGPPQ